MNKKIAQILQYTGTMEKEWQSSSISINWFGLLKELIAIQRKGIVPKLSITQIFNYKNGNERSLILIKNNQVTNYKHVHVFLN